MHKPPRSSTGGGQRQFFLILALGTAISLAASSCGSGHPPAGIGVTTAPAAISPSASQPLVATTPTMPGTGTWQILPAAPVTTWPEFTVNAWTGSQMIIHGILYAGGNSYRGVTFAYRPATGTWATLAPGPAPRMAQNTDTAVWTGSEMLVLGLTSAAYNPATGTWRPLARGPYPAGGAAVAWTGRQVIIWGGVCCAGLSADGASYTPATGIWQKLPAAPLQPQRNGMGAWTGKELIVAGGYVTAPGGTQRLLRSAAAYNPMTRTWRTLPPMPEPRYSATAVWDGTEALLIGGVLPGANSPSAGGVAYNPAANRWRRLPAMDFGRSGFAAVWTGHEVLVWGGMTGPFAAQTIPPHGVTYNPAANRWSALPQAPLRGRADPAAVWTGSTMIVWGGQVQGPRKDTLLTDAAAYTPGTSR